MEKFPELVTSRLKLINITEQHEQAIFDIMSKQEVMEYYGRDVMEARKEAADMINHFQHLFKEGRGIRWGMVLKETDEFIGSIGIHNYYPHMKRAEVGFELHPDYWRKGIVTEALNRVLEYCFRDLGLFRIGAITFPANQASNGLLEKAGFRKEGLLRGYLFKDGELHEANILSIIKPDWQKKKSEDEKPITYYQDHISQIIKRAEEKGDFDNLPGKGKPLPTGRTYTNPYEAQLYKTMKDNHVLPPWIELANEIDALKEKLEQLEGKERRKLIKEINKKIKKYNFACPPSLQKNKIVE